MNCHISNKLSTGGVKIHFICISWEKATVHSHTSIRQYVNLRSSQPVSTVQSAFRKYRSAVAKSSQTQFGGSLGLRRGTKNPVVRLEREVNRNCAAVPGKILRQTEITDQGEGPHRTSIHIGRHCPNY